nr:hypothetical protein [Tanacetum cinerariifolium]
RPRSQANGKVNEENDSVHVEKVNPFHDTLPLQVGRLELDEVKKVASLLCHADSEYRIEPGYCLSCGASRDVEASNAVVKKAELGVRRITWRRRFVQLENCNRRRTIVKHPSRY